MELLLEQGDAGAALAVRRAEVERHPTLDAYRAWVSTSMQVHAADPTTAAVERLGQRAADQPAYMTELIDILAATGAHDEAWAVGKCGRADPSVSGQRPLSRDPVIR